MQSEKGLSSDWLDCKLWDDELAGKLPGGGTHSSQHVRPCRSGGSTRSSPRRRATRRGGGGAEAAAGVARRRRYRSSSWRHGGRQWPTAGALRAAVADGGRAQAATQAPRSTEGIWCGHFFFFLISDAAISAVDKRIRHTREERKSYDSQAGLLFWALCHGPLL